MSAANPGTPDQWVQGECATAVGDPVCEVDGEGEEACVTPLPHFAGAHGGLRVRNYGSSKLRPSKRASWRRNMVVSLKRYR